MNDNDLLAALRAADPASHHAAPDLDRLLEQTMTTTITPSSPRTRRRWLPATAAAAVLLVAGAVVWGVNTGGDTPPLVAPAPAPVRLTLAGDATGKCRAPEVADFKDLPVAFEGQVTAIKGDIVTLQVTHWYHGGSGDTVEVQSMPEDVATLLGVEFTVGQSYLVSAVNGQVSTCGHSGPSDPELRKLFEAAYPA